MFDRLRAVDPLREVTTGHLHACAVNGMCMYSNDMSL